MRTYDAIVIGSGQAGTPLAKKLAQAGYKTALLEKKQIGGTCINRGCTPTKAMIASAQLAYLFHHSKPMGIQAGMVAVDIERVIERKDQIVELFREGSVKNLEKVSGLDILYGEASFTSSRTIKLVSRDKKDLVLKAELIFINAGAKPAIPEIKGIENVDYFTSTTILDLKQVPEHLIIIGGSYNALEFAQMYRRFGSKVTVIESAPVFLENEDEDISSELRMILEDEDINIMTGIETRSIQNNLDGSIRIIMNADGRRRMLTGSHVLIATGRTPQTKNLCLDKAGVKTNGEGFIKVNNKLETNVAGIYALGDIKGGPAFTHIAYNDHLVLLENILQGKALSIKNRLVPYCIFTDPQLGRIGITEKQAKEKGLKYKVASLRMDKVSRAIQTGNTRGIMKAIVDKKSGLILGASILAAEGGDVMTVLQIAMMGKISYKEIRNGIFAHPTYAESLNNLFMTLDT